MANGKALAAANIAKFEVWASERHTAGDWADYMRQGQLNRTEVAAECGFAKSVLRQNPAVKAALEALEARLRAEGTLPSKGEKSPQTQDEAASASVDRRVVTINNRTEQRVNALEEQNAALRAEVRELREQLKRYRMIDDHLAQTGRMVRP